MVERASEGGASRTVQIHSDHGSYGVTESEFVVVGEQVRYARILDHAWTEGSVYSLVGRRYCFPEGAAGASTLRQVETHSEDLRPEDLEALDRQPLRVSTASASDQERLLRDLTDATRALPTP